MGNKRERIIFGAGCFWGVQEAFDNLEGVLETTVGYMGGDVEDVTYEEVCGGNTGHVEVVEVFFDSSIVSVEELIEFFWKIHDPTQVNRQGPDVGEQYRSVIFYTTEDQREKALSCKEKQERKIGSLIATTIEEAETFWRAEEYHQKYAEKNGGGFCRSF